ncbi:MAG TPA: alpha/beta hydrolase [Bacteroidales bacterium]|nr:alpha/beta hydrolase [Bacteroidales bacterium]HOL96909.1 alpha/beta hydrolase [Bacteroidales bacterium]HOM36751.1 alpha/beta hydrolase [Bacteroidales bacterium]HPD24225.1 alpha/beta hydrolase [Bacteroidales bacterium]HRS98466.1 alpha/beta hydrolase [Bacteroidales bacterium]
MKIIENWFRTPDGKTIFYNEFLPDDISKVRFVLQIAHGMAEHSERYTHFAKFLVEKGAAVYASDHRGHGRNCLKPGQYGVWKRPKTWDLIIDDLKILNDIAAKSFPNVPVFILGHSMGSFLIRSFITRYCLGVKGVILTGSGTFSKIELIFGRILASLQCFIFGPGKKAKLLNKLSFGKYDKKFGEPYAWLTRDKRIVKDYIADPYCGGVFSCSFYKHFFSGILFSLNFNEARKIPKSLPIIFLSGEDDPVGDFGIGVKKAMEFYKKAGLKNVEFKLYPSARHEILNEINKEDIYNDILMWIEKNL